MSALSAQFSQTRSAAAFAAWYAAEPQPAATWLKSVATRAGATDVASAVDAFAAPSAPTADQATAVTALFSQLDAKVMGDLQAARAATIGWTATLAQDPPSITGTVSVENGAPVLTSPIGKFALVNTSYFTTDYLHYLGGLDALAFAGRVITVRGWPDATWQPGSATAAKLVVEEFAPGASPDFLSGRVVSDGTNVYVQVRPDKKVQLTNPALIEQLKAHDKTGVMLPGAVKQNGAQFVYDGAPADFYLLAGFGKANDQFTKTPDGTQVNFTLELGHGGTAPCTVPAARFDAGPARTTRHFFFGHLENGAVKTQMYTPAAGGWQMGTPVPTNASTKFVEWATPVDPPAVTADQASFSPAA